MTHLEAWPKTLKQCCAAAYDHDAVRILVGDALHPGGAQLTERLGRLLNLTRASRVLDVASGRGDGALVLAACFGCEVVGLDFGRRNVEAATNEARLRGLEDRVAFYCGDAEKLPFADGTFDAVVCECALCTFPDKPTAVAEFARALKPGGRVGISDLTRSGPLPRELEGVAAWIACVADARPLDEYHALLAGAGLAVSVTETHDGTLVDFVEAIRSSLFATEIMVALKKVELPGIDLAMVKDIVRQALAAAKSGTLGYAIVTAAK
jgi:ubiquinone/menaquinone biosynthesis C-methylase UbiE